MSYTMLFGDDGSACADVGWLWINSHDWPGWRIDVLNAGVVDEPPAARQLLRSTVAEGLTQIHSSGDPRYELHTRGATSDLIVIGAKGRGLLKRMKLGSTAEWLMNGPSAPLVITRTGRPTHRVLLAHDGSGHARAAEEAIAGLPWIGQSTVLVVVTDEHDDADNLASSVSQRLAGVAGRVDTEILRPDDLQTFYRPRDLVLSAADAWNADLIALGSRGLTAWESINEIGLHRAGSTASGIAHLARMNVLLAQAHQS